MYLHLITTIYTVKGHSFFIDFFFIRLTTKIVIVWCKIRMWNFCCCCIFKLILIKYFQLKFTSTSFQVSAGSSCSKVGYLNKVISEFLFFLYLESVVIYCHWTCKRTKSLPQQQTRTFFKYWSQTTFDLFGFEK